MNTQSIILIHFCNKLRTIPSANQYLMASFDIESLYTNIPLQETINICTNLVFNNCNSTVHGFLRKQFSQLLEMSVINSFFIFSGKLYKQIDGLGMGLPLSSTMANIFMSFYETKWLTDCPAEFKPKFYRRYVDDTFLLFSRNEDAIKITTMLVQPLFIAGIRLAHGPRKLY